MPALDATSLASIRRPIGGPSVWFADDMRGREADWSYRLSAAEVAELETALRAVQARDLDVAAISRQDFPLPTLGPVLDRLCNDVLNGRGFVLLRGVPVENRPIAESAAMYWGIGTLFRQRAVAERQGSSAGPCLRPWRQQRDRSDHSQLRNLGATEFPYRSLRRGGAVVPAAREVGRPFRDRQLDGSAQCDAGAAA